MNDAHTGEDIAAQTRIRTRRVYYISGFDPRGASYYHRLYREESASQAKLNGANIQVGSRKRLSSLQHRWDIDAVWEGHHVEIDYRFLAWDDIVRQHWESSHLKLLQVMIGSYARFVSCGALGRISRAYRSFFYTLIYPVVITAASGLVGLGAASLLAGMLMGAGISGSLAWLAVLACLPLSIWGVVKLEDRLKTFWLLRTILFVIRWGGAVPHGMSERMDEFADIIERDLTEQTCDEVMVVGHSVGTILAVSVVARLLQRSKTPPHLVLVTLGQCIPLLSLFPGASGFRRDIEIVATQSDMPWLDVIARADPLCSYEADPVEISGIKSPSIMWPQRKDVSILKMYSSENYRRMKLNKLRLHFQYLMSSELLTDYDYFRLTAGSERFPYQAKKTT